MSQIKFMMKNHPFHLVTVSPWPLILSFNIMNFLMGVTLFFYTYMSKILFVSLITMLLILYQWWRDVIRESLFQGFHCYYVMKLMGLGMILFIISEFMFFVSFFWTYFHSSISSGVEIGISWPPKNIKLFNPYNIPLLNSIILISSGFMITWSHYSLFNNKFFFTKLSLLITIMLGVYFSILQIFEYNEAYFCYNDSVYGSIFYLTTGFHGSHVNIGIIFLISCYIRMLLKHFSIIHHFHFEASIWYWHFVDIIWLFVYLIMYWWIY